jgi:cell division septum initiation protein DivIVA
MSWYWGECCLMHKENAAGLAVLEPLIAKLERFLAETTVTKTEARDYRRLHNSLGQLSARLKRGRGEAVEIPPDIPEVALRKAMSKAAQKTRASSFADQLREYKAIEADFIKRAANDASLVLEIRQHVTDLSLKAARDTAQPFDTCRDLWNEMRSMGLTDSGREITVSSRYAECCLQNKQFEAGIAVVEPLIAEALRLLADPSVNRDHKRTYHYNLTDLKRLLGALKAQQGQP